MLVLRQIKTRDVRWYIRCSRLGTQFSTCTIILLTMIGVPQLYASDPLDVLAKLKTFDEVYMEGFTAKGTGGSTGDEVVPVNTTNWELTMSNSRLAVTQSFTYTTLPAYENMTKTFTRPDKISVYEAPRGVPMRRTIFWGPEFNSYLMINGMGVCT